MQLFTNLSELPYNSQIKLTVYQDGKALISFLTRVVDAVEEKTQYGYGIIAKAIYYQNKRLNFSKFNIVLSYMSADYRQYEFPIKHVDYDYDNGRLTFYSNKNAQPVNKRSAYRFEAGFLSTFTVKELDKPYSGYVKDVSYAGVAFICEDPDNEIEVGQQIIGGTFTTNEGIAVHDVNGMIVRVVPNWKGEKTLVGVKLDDCNGELKDAIYQMQQTMLKVKSQQKSFYH